MVNYGFLDENFVSEYLCNSEYGVLVYFSSTEVEKTAIRKHPPCRSAHNWNNEELEFYNVLFKDPLQDYNSLFDFKIKLTEKASTFFKETALQLSNVNFGLNDITQVQCKSQFIKSLFLVMTSDKNCESYVDMLAIHLFENVFDLKNLIIHPKIPFDLYASGGKSQAIPDIILQFIKNKNDMSFMIVEDKSKDGDEFPKAQAQALAELIAVSENYKVENKTVYFIIIKGKFVKAYRTFITLNFLSNVRKGQSCQELTIIDSSKALSCSNPTELQMICEILCGIEEYYMNSF